MGRPCAADHRPVLGSGTVTGAGAAAPNTVATRSLTACTPASIVLPGGRWYMTATTYRASWPAKPTVLVHQCLPPGSDSIDQPSLVPGCWAAPAAHTPQRWISPTCR